MNHSARLLKHALPLVKVYGFTREALARSVLQLPPTETGAKTHTEPLSDTAISALFGEGDEARRTLICEWLQEGLRYMGSIPGVEQPTIITKEDLDPVQNLYPHSDASQRGACGAKASIRDVLYARLKYNEPVLSHLPEVQRQIFFKKTKRCA